VKRLLDYDGEPNMHKDRSKNPQNNKRMRNKDLSNQFLDEKKRQAAEPLFLKRYE
jgi:hypothetical protein